ncbi:hypothetical protein L1049_000652 [Liquidambar formosana]|uniref:Receptor-like serine/threonine-protein kinase n=1 Tax=Liquidambar formosana TaxID=63359 RepID=A0AAP0R350_LIQFO
MANKGCLMLLHLSCFYICFPYLSHAEAVVFTIVPGQQLRDSEHIVSAKKGIFKLGFFNPGSSNHRYLGIWYSKLPKNPEAVWVANPNSPILDSSGILSLDTDGKLKITYSGGQPIVLNSNPVVTSNVTATLLDSGNFVLTEVNSDGEMGQILWQSFDYPTNMLLPGMKLGMNLKTGHTWSLTSWSSDQVPAPGAFTLGVDPGEASQLLVQRREKDYWTSGGWKDGSFQMFPELTRMVDIYQFSFVTNQYEKYFSYSVRNSSLSRWELDNWGRILQFTSEGDFTTWRNTTISPCKSNVDYPTATCLEERPAECRNSSELFMPTRGYIKGNEFLNNNTNLTLSDCEASCWNNCSCAAYKTYSANGTGCQFWSERSHFVRNENFDVLYLLTQGNGEGGTKKDPTSSILQRWWIWCIMATGTALAMLLFGYLCCSRKRKLKLLQKTGEGETSQDNSSHPLSSRGIPAYKLKRARENGYELQLFSFIQISSATDNFTSANKLGEGGFGPVYKGTLLDGQQVAVKRLSRSSGQGLDEFKNEITLIAGLQHMNLVRLLGCCIQGDEKMLIYEYLPNKSLDFFIFDPDKRKLLDWKRRFSIIEGIAQGILYLHKYSRLRVIHRDLKASNILLDDEMNPKISDFGMARIFGQHESEANTKRVVGTYGYMSPEYAMNGIFSVKSDVFSFGVLLLEIVSGKKNTVFSNSSGHLSLIEHAWDLWKNGNSLELKDALLDSSFLENELLRCICVGLLCVQECATDRPTMSDIISMLTNETAFLPDPKKPAFYIGTSQKGVAMPSGKSNNCSTNYISISVMEAR